MKIDAPTIQVTLRPDGDYQPANAMAEKLAGIAKNGQGQLNAEDMMEIRAMGFAVEVRAETKPPPFMRREYRAYKTTTPAKPRHVLDHA